MHPHWFVRASVVGDAFIGEGEVAGGPCGGASHCLTARPVRLPGPGLLATLITYALVQLIELRQLDSSRGWDLVRVMPPWIRTTLRKITYNRRNRWWKGLRSVHNDLLVDRVEGASGAVVGTVGELLPQDGGAAGAPGAQVWEGYWEGELTHLGLSPGPGSRPTPPGPHCCPRPPPPRCPRGWRSGLGRRCPPGHRHPPGYPRRGEGRADLILPPHWLGLDHCQAPFPLLGQRCCLSCLGCLGLEHFDCQIVPLVLRHLQLSPLDLQDLLLHFGTYHSCRSSLRMYHRNMSGS